MELKSEGLSLGDTGKRGDVRPNSARSTFFRGR